MSLVSSKHYVIFFLLFACNFLFSLINATSIQTVGRNGYEYILPQRKVSICPAYAASKFTCPVNHVITIDRVLFSYGENNNVGECELDKKLKCNDNGDAFNFAHRTCSGHEYCTLKSYDLRTRTKCFHNQIVVILFKCLPTWEIIDVPVKCDICKNVTITNFQESYGFIHSAWYPKLYPRVTCHSLIKNKPNHMIVMFTITGSIGLDKIRIESLNYDGHLVSQEVLTGNLTAKQILISYYDVSVTIFPEDSHFTDQRRFLLYFYLVPICFQTSCKNDTIVIPPGITNSTVNVTVFPPVNIKHHHHSKFSDAWLAAILALAFALLMLIAVLTALCCRRRMQREKLAANTLANSRQASTSQIIAPNAPQMSRGGSMVSMADVAFDENRNRSYYLSTPAPPYPYTERGYSRESSFRRGFRSGPSDNVGYVDYSDENRLSRRSEQMQRYQANMNQQHSLRSSIKRSISEGSLNRGIEYTQSPKIERIRVQHLDVDDNDSNYAFERQYSGRRLEYENRLASRSLNEMRVNHQSERTVSARFYPDDGYDKEIQELSMYVDSNNQMASRY